MHKVFIDTSAFIALFIRNERDHQMVAERYAQYQAERSVFYTSTYILDELFTRLIYDVNATVASKLINQVSATTESGQLRLLDVDLALFYKAIPVVKKYCEHALSFTDATTYVLMKEYHLDEVFTLDADFKKLRIRTSF